MKIDNELEEAFLKTKDVSQELIEEGERNKIKSNERYFHHIFSSYLISQQQEKFEDIWKSLWCIPEWKTSKEFLWKKLDLDNASEATKDEWYEKGSRGRIDFKITDNPEILVEWEGSQFILRRE